MVHVLYYRIDALHPRFEFYLHQLPLRFQEQIVRFRDRKDAERSLFGKLLLLKGLDLLGLNEHRLTELKYTNFQRPYFNEAFDFNIAHSGEYIVCAISKTNKVGIDVEEIRPTTLKDFRTQFTKEEWSEITSSENSLKAFYTLWTQKEATIKAFGEGLSIPLKKIYIANGKAVWDNKAMYLFQLDLSHTNVSYLATDTSDAEIVMHQIYFD
ncbi:4'-phosphopantetheinyl transferase family protein [Pontibacter pamirensis]|uniref:4'-phosphopantetheinyl transferase family protein n=1 Tax=Pontibacter pamirensis TaxID=2562824 RepID=UPI001389FD1B|nr:4'-phosphopantetheinyl transferase superfamily protein [Pontibacter pamirensis]